MRQNQHALTFLFLNGDVGGGFQIGTGPACRKLPDFHIFKILAVCHTCLYRFFRLQIPRLYRLMVFHCHTDVIQIKYACILAVQRGAEPGHISLRPRRRMFQCDRISVDKHGIGGLCPRVVIDDFDRIPTHGFIWLNRMPVIIIYCLVLNKIAAACIKT